MTIQTDFGIKIRHDNNISFLMYSASQKACKEIISQAEEVITGMGEKEKKILDTFEKVLPDMSELEREKLLSFGEGIAFKTAEQKKREQEAEKEVS